MVIKEAQGSINQISFDIDGNLTAQETLSSDQITALEISLQTDLNADGTAGVYVNSEVFSRYSGSGDSSDKRNLYTCLLYTSPSPRDVEESRMPSSA